MADSLNEKTYGEMADSYAKYYNIDVDTFRNLIRSESSFDPYAINPQSVNGENASGIAQFLPSTAREMGVNVFDAESSLNGAAKYLSKLVKQYGGYELAIAKYKGYSNENLDKGREVARGLISDKANEPEAEKVDDSWLGEKWGDIKSIFSQSALGLMIGVIGFLIIAFTIWRIFWSSDNGK
jgi:soluble lytic murein transglycosylase-like protein